MALSRRALMGSGVALAALPALAKKLPGPSGTVRLSANENPFGACPGAMAAMRDACARAWRYPDEAVDELRAEIAKLHGVPPEWVIVGDGSSEILKLATSAFTGPGRKLITADPTFESCAAHAQALGAPVVKIPLDAAFEHDLEHMSAGDAGLIYVCNPNNPTASLTRAPRLEAFIARADSMVLVDEAYHHYVDSADYRSVIPLVKSQPKLIVSRTFSKIYGLAGARLGYAIAQRPVIDRLADQAAFDSVNIFALAAGRASLADPKWAADGKRRNAATRGHVVSALGKLGFTVIPPHANFLMFDTRKPVKPLIEALKQRGVEVGRLFPALPTHLRVTIGRPEQMDRFLPAFAAVVA